jgi:tRNA(His) 5'-end guanylyltransferase
MLICHELGHINNLYNTTFWALIQLGGMDGTEAEKTLKVTLYPFHNAS